MSDERKRRGGDWTPLFDAWPTAEPTRGFSDRVLAACDLPPPVQLSIVREPPPRRVSGSGLLLCAAIAAALIVLPFAIHRRQPPTTAAAGNVVTLGNSFDLGPEHD